MDDAILSDHVIVMCPKLAPCQVDLVVSVPASHTVGLGFASRSDHTKDHHKNGTDCLLTLPAYVRVGV